MLFVVIAKSFMLLFAIAFKREITIMGAIQKKSHEKLYNANTKKAKRLRATTFAFAKLEEQLLDGEQK